MDGFSSRILWLEVTRSNNDPKVVAAFYLKQVKELGGCPLLLVTDCGSENGIAASIQCMFRTNDQDELAVKSVLLITCKSTNRRVVVLFQAK